MNAAAAGERYEEAAHLRDAIRTVEAARERQQKMATAGLNDRDVIGVKLGSAGAVVQVFVFRAAGSSSGSSCSTPTQVADGARGGARGRAPAALRGQRPAAGDPRPGADRRQDVLEAWLSARAERRVRIVVPQRGDKKDMVDLAQRNAAFTYRTRFDEHGGRPTTTRSICCAGF